MCIASSRSPTGRVSMRHWRGCRGRSRGANRRSIPSCCCSAAPSPSEILKACQNAALARETSVDDIWGARSFQPQPHRPATKIRVGYVSANFYDHAVGTLICQLLESHDRNEFEIFCYCHSAGQDRVRGASASSAPPITSSRSTASTISPRPSASMPTASTFSSISWATPRAIACASSRCGRRRCR